MKKEKEQEKKNKRLFSWEDVEKELEIVPWWKKKEQGEKGH